MTHVSISIDVPDLDQAVDFYCRALACTKLRDQGNMSVISNGSVEIFLLKRASGSKPLQNSENERAYDRHWTPVHLDFVVDDVDSAVKLITKFGGSVEGTESGDWGSIAYCADPFGHGFCVIKE